MMRIFCYALSQEMGCGFTSTDVLERRLLGASHGVWGLSSHSSIAEDSGLPEHDAVQLGEWLLTFKRIMVPWS